MTKSKVVASNAANTNAAGKDATSKGRKARGRGLIKQGNEDYLGKRGPGRIPDSMKKIQKYKDFKR